jgi:tRNA/rRNA methyltransferase
VGEAKRAARSLTRQRWSHSGRACCRSEAGVARSGQIDGSKSFRHRIAIELVNPGEGEAIAADRASRRSWLEARDYRVIDIRAADVERDIEAELVRLQGMMAEST